MEHRLSTDKQQIPKAIKEYKKKVILIDDDYSMLILNKEILELANYDVEIYQSARQVLNLLTENTQVNLILLDMYMDEMTGLDFISELDKKLPNFIKKTPIVFLTALDEMPESKASGFIKKTVSIKNFLENVNFFLRINNPKQDEII